MGVRCIKIAAVYFFLAILLGIGMGIGQNFAYTSVHAHLNLLAWVSLALFGLIYLHYPKAGETGLAKTHFWLHNIGLPIMQGGLFLEIMTANKALVVAPIVGSLMIGVGVLCFLINVFQQVKVSSQKSGRV